MDMKESIHIAKIGNTVVALFVQCDLQPLGKDNPDTKLNGSKPLAKEVCSCTNL